MAASILVLSLGQVGATRSDRDGELQQKRPDRDRRTGQHHNRSHYLGAVYGVECIMGRAENPVRRVLNYASDHFLSQIPIVYVLTVVGTA